MDAPAQGIIRSRIANACDGCKARKVKCDGKTPCSYCIRRQRPSTCKYSHPRRTRQRHAADAARTPASTASPRASRSSPPSTAAAVRSTRATSLDDDGHGAAACRGMRHSGSAARRSSVMEEDDTEVPLEARLLCDAQGKLIFIGDCAPLSFFQSVRQLVTSRVGQNAFAPETSRYSVLENAPAAPVASHEPSPPALRREGVRIAVQDYILITTSLVDLFDEKLESDVAFWASHQRAENLTTTIHYLVLAIGLLKTDEATSRTYFEYGKAQAFNSLNGSMGVGTVHAFILVTVYMLCSCQINNAFLVFGIASRAAYSVGVHRTEVNARFGPEIHRQRDRTWKSMRIVDLFLSVSMGRPPATSDVDCTVPYRATDLEGNEVFDLLNASVQIMLITEGIVTEIYSRKKISLQLTEGISKQLREWSERWLHPLKDVLSLPGEHTKAQISGACQVLASYYYAVMLVSRPFLMYELFRRLGDEPNAARYPAMSNGKSKLADACIEAASMMVDPIAELIEQRVLHSRMPLLVSWLFASSLVLGVGLLGNFGRILEKYTRISIQALDHFAQADTHATQYSLIAQSLLNTALEHLEKRELQERLRRTESSSQLFGLIPQESRARGSAVSPATQANSTAASPAVSTSQRRHSLFDRSLFNPQSTVPSPRGGDLDPSSLFGPGDVFGGLDANFWSNQGNEDPSSALNLFPLLEGGGGIDLAHYL
ncbi:uncharacterized protein J7T54_006652 [Emericellopsis cladophorae]|uniref:Zn(2)-C6 fungal-type domain-containing protein n=1 Tax=Emericellopsis cladophorae TaxID=2686198 RepID=A0A9Q0BG36_9HYPO|nr:uncharacterized protein J7T54_006652 [Emericellopsis cladophorae]KAI6784607.1 hypothetical protein J7T54_006652 [Emericellopsis cladophorae]